MDKLDIAIKRIKEASDMSLYYYEKPLLLTYSGGKDSDAVREVAKIAGIPYEIQHSHTTADAPETVRHVRKVFRELEQQGVKCTINYPVYKGERTSMWKLIPQKLMPPTRLVRYCCAILKETAGKDRFIATGVRWDESPRRKNTRGVVETINRNPDKRIILTNDNDDKRVLFESCARLGAKTVNPIIDWDNNDVWDFLHDQNTNVNPLYCDFGRVGCVGCPLAGKKGREAEFLRWPKYKSMWISSFDKMIKSRCESGKMDSSWRMGTSGVDVFNWWMEYDVLPGQIDLLEDYDGQQSH